MKIGKPTNALNGVDADKFQWLGKNHGVCNLSGAPKHNLIKMYFKSIETSMFTLKTTLYLLKYYFMYIVRRAIVCIVSRRVAHRSIIIFIYA